MQIGPSRHRSVPALSGTIAASPAANISRHSVSALLNPAAIRSIHTHPMPKNGPAPSQSQRAPPAAKRMDWAAGNTRQRRSKQHKNYRRDRQRAQRPQHRVCRRARPPQPLVDQRQPSRRQRHQHNTEQTKAQVHLCSFCNRLVPLSQQSQAQHFNSQALPQRRPTAAKLSSAAPAPRAQ